jgi:hypothetical protein
MQESAIRFIRLYLQQHEVKTDEYGNWLLRQANGAAQMETIVRDMFAAVPCPEPHRSTVMLLMRNARAARKRALRTPPGAKLEIALLEWHLSVARAAATVQLPYAAQAMKGRRRVIAAGAERREIKPRNAAARMKRMGTGRQEAGEYLKRSFPEISERTRRNIIAEVYGARRKK